GERLADMTRYFKSGEQAGHQYLRPDSRYRQHAGIARSAQPLRRMPGADQCDQLLHLRQNACDDYAHPRRAGMQAVVLGKAEVGGDAVEEERIEQYAVFGGQLWIDAIEGLIVVGPEIGRRAHAAQQNGDMAIG